MDLDFLIYAKAEEMEESTVIMKVRVSIDEEKDTIGKRYRRMDAIGTPFSITVDYQSKEDQTVTIRYRDSMQQERIPISAIREIVEKQIL